MSIDAEPQRTAQGASLSERVGLEIKLEMLRVGISGRRLALRLGVSQTWISTRTTGATPIDLNELQRISDALGIDAGELLARAATGAVRSSSSPKESLAGPARTARPRSTQRSPRPRDSRPPSGVSADKRRPALLRSA